MYLYIPLRYARGEGVATEDAEEEPLKDLTSLESVTTGNIVSLKKVTLRVWNNNLYSQNLKTDKVSLSMGFSAVSDIHNLLSIDLFS
jgi:hypothetical protein